MELSKQSLQIAQEEAAETTETLGRATALTKVVRQSTQHLFSTVVKLRNDYTALEQSIRTDLVQIFAQQLQETSASIARKADAAVADATAELQSKYRYEFRQRKLLYNKLQELKGADVLNSC